MSEVSGIVSAAVGCPTANCGVYSGGPRLRLDTLERAHAHSELA